MMSALLQRYFVNNKFSEAQIITFFICAENQDIICYSAAYSKLLEMPFYYVLTIIVLPQVMLVPLTYFCNNVFHVYIVV